MKNKADWLTKMRMSDDIRQRREYLEQATRDALTRIRELFDLPPSEETKKQVSEEDQ